MSVFGEKKKLIAFFIFVSIIIVLVFSVYYRNNLMENSHIELPVEYQENFTYDFLNTQLNTGDYDGLSEFIMIEHEPVVIKKREKNSRYSNVVYRFKFKNISDSDINFYFQLTKNPEFTTEFYDIEQNIAYNKKYVTLEAGQPLGTTATILVLNPNNFNSEQSEIFDKYLNEFMGYFKVDDKEYIQKIKLE